MRDLYCLSLICLSAALFTACSNSGSVPTNSSSSSSSGAADGTQGLMTVATVEPRKMPSNGGTILKLTGTGFAAGMSIKVGSTDCPVVSLTGDTQMTCQVSAQSAGFKDLIVTKPSANEFRAPRAIEIQNATISLSATNAEVTGGEVISVRSSTRSLIGAQVSVGGTACLEQTPVNAYELLCKIPPRATAGGVVVSVLLTNGETALAPSFLYLPVFTAVSPPSVGAGDELELTGKGFVGTPQITIGTGVCLDPIVTGTELIRCKVGPNYQQAELPVVLKVADAPARNIPRVHMTAFGLDALVDSVKQTFLDPYEGIFLDREIGMMKSSLFLATKIEVEKTSGATLEHLEIRTPSSPRGAMPGLTIDRGAETITLRSPEFGFYEIYARVRQETHLIVPIVTYAHVKVRMATLSVQTGLEDELEPTIESRIEFDGDPEVSFTGSGAFFANVMGVAGKIRQKIKDGINAHLETMAVNQEDLTVVMDPLMLTRTVPQYKPMKWLRGDPSPAAGDKSVSIVFVGDRVRTEQDKLAYEEMVSKVSTHLMTISSVFSGNADKFRFVQVHADSSGIPTNQSLFLRETFPTSPAALRGVTHVVSDYGRLAQLARRIPGKGRKIFVILANGSEIRPRAHAGAAEIVMVTPPLSSSPGTYEALAYTLAHELGHTLGGLADEYVDTSLPGDDRARYYGDELLTPNFSKFKFKWNHLKGTAGIDYFEGAIFQTGAHRPSQQSLMRVSWYGQFDAVGAEAMNRSIRIAANPHLQFEDRYIAGQASVGLQFKWGGGVKLIGMNSSDQDEGGCSGETYKCSQAMNLKKIEPATYTANTYYKAKFTINGPAGYLHGELCTRDPKGQSIGVKVTGGTISYKFKDMGDGKKRFVARTRTSGDQPALARFIFNDAGYTETAAGCSGFTEVRE